MGRASARGYRWRLSEEDHADEGEQADDHHPLDHPDHRAGRGERAKEVAPESGRDENDRQCDEAEDGDDERQQSLPDAGGEA